MVDTSTVAEEKKLPPPLEDDEDAELGASMSFLEHLTELRERLIKSLIALAIGIAIAFMFKDVMMFIIKYPLPLNVQLQELAPAEGLMVTFKVAFVAGIFLAFPVLFYQAWMFIAPGLYKRERRLVLPIIVSAWICFIIGGVLSYLTVFSLTLDFLSRFVPEIQAEWGLANYVTFALRFIVAFGIVFEEPVVIFLLARIGLVTRASLIQFFPYATVTIFVVAAVITPPDPFSQILCALPLMLLYGLSIFIVGFVEKTRG